MALALETSVGSVFLKLGIKILLLVFNQLTLCDRTVSISVPIPSEELWVPLVMMAYFLPGLLGIYSRHILDPSGILS